MDEKQGKVLLEHGFQQILRKEGVTHAMICPISWKICPNSWNYFHLGGEKTCTQVLRPKVLSLVEVN